MTDTTTPTAETGTRRELGLDGDWRAALRAPLVLALAAALVVQLALALMLGGGHSMAPAAQDEPLLDLDLDKVAELDIASGDGASLVLRRSGDAWVLPGLGDFPASDTRVQSLLDDLDGLKRPLPEATSADAQRRFKVADDNFERRLTLRGGGKQATLFVGDSPGFRRTFARVDGEDAVYDLRLGLFDLSDKADDWIDRGQLQIDRGKITGIAAADADGGPAGKWALTRGEEGWSLAGSDGKVDGAATDALVDAVATVSYSGVLAPDSDAKYDLDAPKRVLTVDYDGKQRRYLLAPIGDSGDYALKRDGSPYVYRIGAFDAETLVGTDQDKLLGKKKPEAGAGDEGAAGAVGEAPAPAAGDAAAGAASQPAATQDAQAPTPAASAEAAKEMEPGPAADATPTQEARPPQQRP